MKYTEDKVVAPPPLLSLKIRKMLREVFSKTAPSLGQSIMYNRYIYFFLLMSFLVYIFTMNFSRLFVSRWIKSDILFILFLTLLAGVLRFYKITELPCGLFPDEAIHGLDALRFAHGFISPVYHGNEGLFVYFVALSHFFFGTGIWQIFIVSAFIGTLTIPAVFLFVREIFGRNAAFFTGFFLAISPWHIALSRNGFRAILVPLFISLTLFFFFKALHSDQLKKRRMYFAFCALSFALGFYTYYSYLAFPLMLFLLLLFFLFFQKKRLLSFYSKNRALLVESIVFFCVVIFPLLLFIVLFPSKYFGRIQEVSSISSAYNFFDSAKYFILHFFETLTGIFTHGDPNWRHNAGNNAFLSFLLFPFFLVGVLLSFFRKGFSRTLPFFFVGMILPAALSREGFTPHGLRLIGVIPFLFIFPALSFSSLLNFLQNAIRRYKLKKPLTSTFSPANTKVRLQTVFVFQSFLQTSLSYFLKFGVVLFFTFLTFQGYSNYFREAPLDKEYYNAFRCDLTAVTHYIKNHKNEKIELIIDDYSYFTLKYLFYPEVIPYHSPQSFFNALQAGNVPRGRMFLIAISYGDTYWKIKKFLEKEHIEKVILNPYGEPAFYLFGGM